MRATCPAQSSVQQGRKTAKGSEDRIEDRPHHHHVVVRLGQGFLLYRNEMNRSCGGVGPSFLFLALNQAGRVEKV
jgi:hypothetical protein